MGPEPFDPVVDPPFFDLALRLAEARPRFPLSSTARTARPTPSAPGVPPGRSFMNPHSSGGILDFWIRSSVPLTESKGHPGQAVGRGAAEL
jgi:hypothetical protein